MDEQLLSAACCPVCDDTAMQSLFSPDSFGIDFDDPLLASPVARLYAIALMQGIHVATIPAEEGAEQAGVITVRSVGRGKAQRSLGFAEDIEDGLLADLLAFGITIVTLEQARLSRLATGRERIGVERLPVAQWQQTGHVAWHMARRCGRLTTSAMFELIEDS